MMCPLTIGEDVTRITEIVKAFVVSPGDSTMAKVVKGFTPNQQLKPQDIVFLAEELADSGSRLKPQPEYADIPSTGGIASLSTVLCPLYLRHFGMIVPKLTVPGSPAGGIDILAQIPGYRTEFRAEEIQQLLDDSGYVHFVSGGQFAPLD